MHKSQKILATLGKVCSYNYNYKCITKPLQKDLEFSRQNCGARDFLNDADADAATHVRAHPHPLDVLTQLHKYKAIHIVF